MTAGLYALVFYRVDVGDLASRLASTRLAFVAAGVTVYIAGQMLSAYKWRLLLRPVELTVAYTRLVAFYFIGMFFNIFLPTIVGGDAVKAVLLARETGAPARATMSVFMERNVGLLALLTIATGAAWYAPPVRIAGLPLPGLTLLLFGAFAISNVVLVNRGAYALADRLIALTPLARMRPRASSLYGAIVPYKTAPGTLLASVALSFVFQAVVILVVFLNTRALDQRFPVFALAVFVPLISLAAMVPVSVNGLGVREALYLLLFGQLGSPPDVSVSLALLYFAVTFAASLPGGVVYAMHHAPARRNR